MRIGDLSPNNFSMLRRTKKNLLMINQIITILREKIDVNVLEKKIGVWQYLINLKVRKIFIVWGNKY